MGRDKNPGKSKKSSRREDKNTPLQQDEHDWSQEGQTGDFIPGHYDEYGQWHDDTQTPRTTTLNFDSLHISEDTLPEDGGTHSGKHRSRSGKGKGKEKETEADLEEFDDQGPSQVNDDGEYPEYVLDGASTAHSGGQMYYNQDVDGDYDGGGAGGTYANTTVGIADDEEFTMAMQESQVMAYSGHDPGEGSMSHQPALYEPTTSDHATDPDPLSSPPAFLIRPKGKNTYRVKGTYGDEEELDPRFRVHNSREFAIGAVFIVFWPEPRGENSRPVPEDDAPTLITVDEIYVSYRRFIVVATDEGHSTCVPILTYEGRACKKSGVKQKKHGIIYSYGYNPRLLKDEPDLGFDPVMLTEYHGVEDRLDKASRVNYSKLVTVEHNVKVRFLGSIDEWHYNIVQAAINECWAGKMLKPTKSSKHHHSSHDHKNSKEKSHKSNKKH